MTSWHSREAPRPRMAEVLASVPADLRRARLLAARRFGVCSVPRRAILRGDWDRGDAVRQFLVEEGDGR